MPSSVIVPGMFMLRRSIAVTETSSLRLKIWFGVGMCWLKTSDAIFARAG